MGMIAFDSPELQHKLSYLQNAISSVRVPSTAGLHIEASRLSIFALTQP